MVNVDTIAPLWLGKKFSGRLALVLYSSDEPSELSRWQHHDAATLNIWWLLLDVLVYRSVVRQHNRYTA